MVVVVTVTVTVFSVFSFLSLLLTLILLTGTMVISGGAAEVAAAIEVGLEVGGCTVDEGRTDDSGDAIEVTAVVGTGSCGFVGFSGCPDS